MASFVAGKFAEAAIRGLLGLAETSARDDVQREPQLMVFLFADVPGPKYETLRTAL